MIHIVNVYKLPEYIDIESLSRGTAVVIDVLRASTTITYALAAGAKAVIPCGEIEESLAVAAKFPADEKILSGERGGLPIDGFDLGNSPEEYTPERVRGKTIVFTTTNGTRALLHAKKAKQILLGAFVNASAVAERLIGQETVHLLCAGTDGQPTDEDIMLAGMLAEKLRQGGAVCRLNHEAIAACDLWRHTLMTIQRDSPIFVDTKIGTVPFKPEAEPLAKILRHTLGGQNLVSLGFERDILAAARIDRFAIVPQYDPETSHITIVK
jgi:2-phosphosulfolactate phosphatase